VNEVHPKHKETRPMTVNYYVLADPPRSAQELTKERPRLATKQSSLIRPKVEAAPETRLWKICAEVAPQRLSGIEWIALLFFAASAFLSLAFCAFEWFHLSNSGALDQIARAILTI
jgi:hypothetical protein